MFRPRCCSPIEPFQGVAFDDAKCACSVLNSLPECGFFASLVGVTSNMERSGGDSRGMRMEDKQTLLSELHRARLDRLKEICASMEFPKMVLLKYCEPN